MAAIQTLCPLSLSVCLSSLSRLGFWRSVPTLSYPLALTGPPRGLQEDKLKLVPMLSDLVIYCKSVHFGGFSNPGIFEQAFYEMASFSENHALRLLQESGELLALQAYDPVHLDWPRPGLSSTPAGSRGGMPCHVQVELVGWVGVSLAHQDLHC